MSKFNTDALFPEDGMPPDAAPRKKPGPKPGSKNKPKGERASVPADVPPAAAPPSFLGDPEPTPQPQAKTEEPAGPAPPDAEVERFRDAVAGFDFRAFGTRPRIAVVIVRDISGSESAHDEEWRTGSRAIPEEIRKNPNARNLIDVAMFNGDHRFHFAAAAHGVEFSMPAGEVDYGGGTHAGPWLRGIRAAAEIYKSVLAAHGVGVRDVIVVVAGDFCFGDDFRAELAGFKAWAKGARVTVVPAGFGDWQPQIAAEFGDVPPVDLKELSFEKFFRVISQQAVEASAGRPGAKPTAQMLADGLKSAQSAR